MFIPFQATPSKNIPKYLQLSIAGQRLTIDLQIEFVWNIVYVAAKGNKCRCLHLL